MKEFDWDKIDKVWIGLVAGIIAPMIAFSAYYLINYRYMTIHGFVNYLRLGDTYTPLISMCVLSCLVPFYIMINKDRYQGTKGVLAATFIWAGLIIYLKFFT